MYSERTHTGINLIDLTERQAIVIRESLRRAAAYCILSDGERRQVDLLRHRLDAVLDPKRNYCPTSKIKSNEKV